VIEVVDGDLVAVEDEAPADEPRVEQRLATAATDRLQFFEAVRHLQQPRRPWKGARAEVGADAVGEHGDAVLYGEPEQVIHLCRREELGLVDQKAGDGADVAGAVVRDERAHVCIRSDEKVHLTLDAEPAGDLVGALRVDLGLRQQNVLTALLVVECSLQQGRRLAGIHRP
jgi:hypothetical protein